MEGSILKLYPQFTQLTDRRQQGQPVNSERRSGEDRRQTERVVDPKLSPDIAKIQDTFKAFIHNADQHKTTVKTLDNTALENKEVTKAVFSALSPIIPFRRISSMPDNIENGDYERAAGLVAVAGIMLPEDLRDMKDAWEQAVHNKLPNYDYKNCQAPFRFIRGTYAEAPVNKMGKYGYILHEFDKSFAETQLGEKLRKLLGVSFGKPEMTGRKVPQVINIDNKYVVEEIPVIANKLRGTFLSKLIYRAIQRTTVIGAIILSTLWIPSIIKAFNKPEEMKDKLTNAGKQTLKASINVVSVLSGIGILGALGNIRYKYVGSVIGMGIGSIVGSFIANKVNKNISTL
ncbi:MAG: hypothetical protein PHC34_02910 [Candidatus Gastranaerophilales bacterium]|nr:hypothetical protein [Candidatus Gastranaerophilales bacterium]